MKTSIIKKFIPVRAPGACKYFQKDVTKATSLPGIETTYEVCVETVPLESDELEASADYINKAHVAKEHCRATVNLESTTGLITFRVCIGDITEFTADVIVNPANGSLRHGGGLAAKIVQKGGQEIQEDCDEYIASKLYDLNEGEVYLSLAHGHLPCKAIVHAVGPRWRKQSTIHEYEKTRLFEAIESSLTVARGYQSIAFPAVSSGIFGYPLPECALVHIEASLLFFEKCPKTRLSDVSFVMPKNFKKL